MFPILFGILTFLLSIHLFSTLAADKAVHDRGFYSNAAPSALLLTFLSVSAKAGVLVKSFILSVFSIILFSGTDYDRIVNIAGVFVLTAAVGTVVLTILDQRSNLNIERWGYVRASLALGLIFSFLISSIDGLGLWGVAKSIIRQTTYGLTLREASELIYGLFAQLDRILEDILIGLFGDFLGKLASLILTVKIAYGFIIYIYIVEYFRLQRIYQRWIEIRLKKPKLYNEFRTARTGDRH